MHQCTQFVFHLIQLLVFSAFIAVPNNAEKFKFLLFIYLLRLYSTSAEGLRTPGPTAC